MRLFFIPFLLALSLYASSIETKNDKELKMILQVFLYKGDLENAYRVASIGYKHNPNSYYWNQKMAELAKWTNNTADSIKYLRFMYEQKYDKKLENELISYGLASYQYEAIESLVVNKARHNPTQKNIDLMILVYKKIGSPEKVIKVLDEEYAKDNTKTILLSKALNLSLEIGDLTLAKKYIDIFEAMTYYSMGDAALIARYYYILHNIKQAYQSLFQIDKTKKESQTNQVQYYQIKSDLGWYLQDNENAAKASKKLITLGRPRLVDYERIIFVLKTKDPAKSAAYAKEAFLKYKLSNFFYTYANSEMERNHYGQLSNLIQDIDRSTKYSVKNDVIYWIIKSKVYKHFKQIDKEKEALEYALSLNPDDYNTRMVLLSHYISIDDRTKVKQILQNMRENASLGFNFYLPIASAYFYLGDINMASFYTQKLLDADNPVTQFISFKFLQAYIYQAQNNEEAFSSYMLDIVDTLEEEEKKNPGLKKQDLHLSNYLRAAMHVLSAKEFQKRLKKAKKYLSKKNYQDISYSWSITNQAYEKSLKIYHKMKSKELWLIFSNNMIFQNHSVVENLLDSYLNNLAVGDAAQSAFKDGQVALSQTIAFEGFLKNDKSQNIYIQHLDLTKQRSDKIQVQYSYKIQSPLIQDTLTLNNKNYLDSGYELYTDLELKHNKLSNNDTFTFLPTNTTYASLGIAYQIRRGKIRFNLHYYNLLTKFYGASLEITRQISTDLFGSLKIHKNSDANDGIALFFGGKKDVTKMELTWNLLDSTQILSFYEYNKFYDQKDLFLGNAQHYGTTIKHKIHNGYPDMHISLFYNNGIYNATEGPKGTIDLLQKVNFRVLPLNGYNYGMSFSYGMVNYQQYTRVWRGYFETTLAYSELQNNYTYTTHIGYGGKVWHQDHLALGFSYTNFVSGVGGDAYELYVKYHFNYHHP